MANILVIEDDRHVWRILEYKLKGADHVPTWAEDGEKALEILSRMKPDLILSDIMVPYIDGLQIVEKIKNDDNLKDIPVIMLTSKAQDRDVIKGLKLGVEDYIAKPFSPDEVVLRVNKALRQN